MKHFNINFTLIVLTIYFANISSQNINPFQLNPYKPVVAQNQRGANDGRYRGDSGRYRGNNAGRYQGGNDGRYGGGDVGRYRGGNDGRYVPDNSGTYTHQDAGYRADDQGGYSGSGTASRQNTGNNQAIPQTTSATIPPIVTSTTIRTTSAPKYDQRSDNKYAIIKHQKEIDGEGYHYLYETENKINAEEEGHIVNKGQDNEGMSAKGFYSYVGDDNNIYTVTYTANDQGFIPQGDHIPTIPPLIQKALQYLEAKGKL